MTSNVKENALFDNEMDFCRCAGEENKDILEDLFLRNRISYFIKWEEKSFLGKLFAGRKPSVVIFRINTRDVALARELVEHAEGVEVICPAIQEDWSPKAKAARRKQEEDRTDEF